MDIDFSYAVILVVYVSEAGSGSIHQVAVASTGDQP